MKALVYNGSRNVNLVEMSDAKVEHSTDVVKRPIPSTNLRPIVSIFHSIEHDLY